MRLLSAQARLVSLLLPFSIARALSGQEAPAPARPTNNVRRAIEWKSFDYTCEAGEKLNVYLHNQSVKVLYQGRVYLMKQVISGSGTRYSDGKVMWRSKGNGGFLQEDTPDGDGKMIVKDCELSKPLNSEAASGSVTGAVSYLVHMALPPTAVVEVMLEGVPQLDQPAGIIAEDRITLGDRQVPVPFELKFDPAKINPKHSYFLVARILVEGQVRYMQTLPYRMLETGGYPAKVEMLLLPVPATTPTNP